MGCSLYKEVIRQPAYCSDPPTLKLQLVVTAEIRCPVVISYVA